MSPSSSIPVWEQVPFCLIGMLHCPALPGAPDSKLSMQELADWITRDAAALAESGFHALMIENFGDTPFFPGRVPPQVVSVLTRLAREVKQATSLPLGVNVLRNDGVGAIAIAVAAELDFVRINVLSGARVTDQGLIDSNAHEVLRFRRQLGGEAIRILADVNVKHSQPLGGYRIQDEVQDVISRSHADGVIVSGSATGATVDRSELEQVASTATPAPTFIGSGFSEDEMVRHQRDGQCLTRLCSGAIVGSSIKVDAVVTNPVDTARARSLVAQVNSAATR